MLPGTPKGSYPGGGRGGQWGAVPLLLPLQTDYKPGSCLFTALTIGLQWDYKRAVHLRTELHRGVSHFISLKYLHNNTSSMTNRTLFRATAIRNVHRHSPPIIILIVCSNDQ